METFVKEKLGGDYDVYSMEHGAQSVHTLVHKRLNGAIGVSQLPRSDKVFERLRIVRTYFLHTKSKISDLKKAKDWQKKTKALVISAINSRQKLSVEMNVIRKYIAHRLYSQVAEA